MESGSLRFVARLNAMVFCFMASVKGTTARSEKNRKITDSATESIFENDSNSNSVITLIWIAVSSGRLFKSGIPSRLSRNPMTMFESSIILPLITHLPDDFHRVAGKNAFVLQGAAQTLKGLSLICRSFRGFGSGFLFKFIFNRLAVVWRMNRRNNKLKFCHSRGDIPGQIKIYPPVSRNFDGLFYRHALRIADERAICKAISCHSVGCT